MYRVVPKKDATLLSITIFGLDFTFSICFDGSTTMFIYIYSNVLIRHGCY